MESIRLVNEEPEKLVAAYFKDPDGNPLVLAPYQADFIKAVIRRDNTRFIYKAATQSGKSCCLSVLLALIAILYPNEKIVNVSFTEQQARIIFDQVKKFLIEDSPVIRAMVDLSRSIGSTKEFSKTRMFMKNGTEIKVLSTGMGDTENVGNSLLGMSATVLTVDEASSIPNDVFTTKILRMLGGKRTSGLEKILILSSTPQTSNFFEDAWHDPDYVKFTVSWKDAVEAGRLDLKTVEEQRRKMTKSQFASWYDAEFPSMLEDSVFDMAECERNLVEPDPIFKGEKILSVDVARFGRDFTVYALVDKLGEEFRVVDFIQDEKKDTMAVAGRIVALNNQHKFNKVIVDEAGVGGGPLDRVREQGIEVFGVIAGSKCTTNAAEENCINLKAELYMKAKKLFEEDKLKIINKGTIMKELRQSKKEFTSNGKLKIIDPDKSPDYLSSLVYSLYDPNYGTFVMISMGGEEKTKRFA
jgi:hypothetical protein